MNLIFAVSCQKKILCSRGGSNSRPPHYKYGALPTKLREHIKLLGVGFEPTRANTDDLKSSPLDLSGMLAFSLKVFTLPNVGLEPTATRLKVLRSTD